MSRRLECRSEGCGSEVVSKTVEGVFTDPTDRRSSGIRAPPPTGRGSPNGYHRHSATTTQMVSPYCKQHTCHHFFREEGCNNKKPPHDSVCAVHARCPVQDCTQARAQYLDTKFEHVPGAVPRYARYELCVDHKCSVRQCNRGKVSPTSTYCQAHGCQAEGCSRLSQDQRNCCEEHECNTDGCRTIVEGNYPYCMIHATCEASRCQEIKIVGSPYCVTHSCRERNCNTACYPKPYCSEHACAESSCEYPRPGSTKQKKRGKFCPMHTCRERSCQEFVDSISLFCRDHGCSKEGCLHEVLAESLCLNHFKDEYLTRGERSARVRTPKFRPQPAERQSYDLGAARVEKKIPRGGSETGSETVSDTESDRDPKDEPTVKRVNVLFNGSNLSTNSNSKRDSRARPIVLPQKDWPRNPGFGGGGNNNNTSGAGGAGGGGQQTKRPQQQQDLRGWDDAGPSPRGSVGSHRASTDSLVAEHGQEFSSGFNTDNGGIGSGQSGLSGKPLSAGATRIL